MSTLQCPECDGWNWNVHQLVPGEFTLVCTSCNHKAPLAEEWQVYANYQDELNVNE